MNTKAKETEFREFVDDKKRRNLKVFKSNNLIEAKYKLSLNEQKLILLLASTIKPDDDDFKPIRFRITDLLNYLGFEDNTTHYTYLRQLTEKLMTRVLKIWDLKRKTLLQINWLSSAEYHFKEGIIELCFDPKLKPFLLKLKEKFTAYSLQIAVKFNSAYSIRIYELLKQYEKIGERTISVEELREFLGIKKEEYRRYNDFKRYVILKAYKELKEKADIYFEFEEKKKGRKIEEIVFYIYKNPNFKEDTQEIRDNKKTKIKVVIAEEKNQTEEKKPTLRIQNEELFEKIKEYTNLTDERIKRIFSIYDEDYIKKIFYLTLEKYKEGKIDNMTAFFLAGLKENYLKLSPFEEKRIKEKEEKEYQERLKQELENELLALHKEYWERLRLEVLAEIQNLPSEERKELTVKYVDSISKNKILLKEYFKKFFESPVVQDSFAKFVISSVDGFRDRLSFKNFVDFLRKKNFDFEKLSKLKEKYRDRKINNLIYLLKVEERLKKLNIPSNLLIMFSIADEELKEKVEKSISDYLFDNL